MRITEIRPGIPGGKPKRRNKRNKPTVPVYTFLPYDVKTGQKPHSKDEENSHTVPKPVSVSFHTLQ